MSDPAFKVKHHPNCSADYPEKVETEAPQQLQHQVISDDGTMECWTCVDCGATITRIQDEWSGDLGEPTFSLDELARAMTGTPGWPSGHGGFDPIRAQRYRKD